MTQRQAGHGARAFRKSADGEGRYTAPRSALQSGTITRREWLRFLEKITLGPLCSCGGLSVHRHWLWHAGGDNGGYATFFWRGRMYKAHRFAYIALRGNILPRLEPDHLCRIRHCVNPACLEVVTRRVNALRGVSPFADHARQTHCKHGHLLAGDNLRPTYLRKGHRVCRLCFDRYQRDLARRKKEAALGERGA